MNLVRLGFADLELQNGQNIEKIGKAQFILKHVF